ncbi:MAG: Ig-like domain-containing protein [Acidobacteriaceae bacterium]|nr:Ig-like domain-containing protein [Acidobacteriaceae bacterium]
MNLRLRASLLLILLGLPLALMLTGCNKVLAISITPAAGTEVLIVGQTAQYSAFATEQMGSAATTTSNISSSVTWTSSNPLVATINSSGLATAVGAGYVTIAALSSNGVTAYSDLTVNAAATTSGSSSSVTSISIIPGSQSVASPNQTSQFLAIGTTSTGTTTNLTNSVSWSSSSAQIASINSAGLATAVSQGTSTITALYASSTGGTVVGTATFTVTGGTAEQYTALTLMPSSVAISASGQTSQLIALATSGTTGQQTDVTSSAQIAWSSSSSTIATVSSSGLVTGKNAGATTITAELTNPDGSIISNTASITTTLTTAPEPLISLTIIPSSLTVLNLKGQGQFLAIGTYSTAPYTKDLTNDASLVWKSSFPNDFTVSSNTGGGSGATAGVVTAYASGSTTIIAEATNPDGTIQTATATFNCPYSAPNSTFTTGSCYSGSEGSSLISTLTVYSEGLNSSSTSPNWLVTASSATGTADVIHCGPGWTNNAKTGGSVCTATYPVGTTVTLTAPAQTGVAFGGWSYNCQNTAPVTASGPNTCTITMDYDNTVGAIFN